MKLDLSSIEPKHRFNGARSIREPRSSTLSEKHESISARTEKQIDCNPSMVETNQGVDVYLQACMRNFYNVER